MCFCPSTRKALINPDDLRIHLQIHNVKKNEDRQAGSQTWFANDCCTVKSLRQLVLSVTEQLANSSTVACRSYCLPVCLSNNEVFLEGERCYQRRYCNGATRGRILGSKSFATVSASCPFPHIIFDYQCPMKLVVVSINTKTSRTRGCRMVYRFRSPRKTQQTRDEYRN